MGKCSSPYPRLAVDGSGAGVVSQAGAVLLLRTAETVGLTRVLPEALGRWRKPLSVHDPGKIVLDLAVAVALGGDCLADIGMLRAEPGVFGPVASDLTVSRVIAALAAEAPKALAAIRSARAPARAEAWAGAGDRAPDHGIDAGHPLIIDLDATLKIAHSDKEAAAPTFKKTFGHHPLGAWADHGPAGTGEPLITELRPGNAGSNTARTCVSSPPSGLSSMVRPPRYEGKRAPAIQIPTGKLLRKMFRGSLRRLISRSLVRVSVLNARVVLSPGERKVNGTRPLSWGCRASR